MAKMVSPPRIGGYFKKMQYLSIGYSSCWPLQYQAGDRWGHEQIPVMHRKESLRHNKRTLQGYWPGYACEESEYHPDYPFHHLLWMSVNSEKANRWWYDHFQWPADKIAIRLKSLNDYVECDAPVAKDREDHAITSFH